MPTQDDTNASPPPISDLLEAQVAEFRKEPQDADLYLKLRSALRESGSRETIAELGELHAPHQKDRLRAAAIWGEAGEARLKLGQTEQAERDLRQAIELDPANERAAARMLEHLATEGRFAEAAQVLETEVAALEERAESSPRAQDQKARKRRGREPVPFAKRRAQRHRVLAALWDERLGRVDRALEHYQRAWQLEPERSDSLECARAIYMSLGDEAMVARLYEAELDGLGETGPRQRRSEILLELGRINAKRGEAMAAANHLEVALRLTPRSMEVREALAEIYASPAFENKEDRQRRAAELFVDLGKKRLKTDGQDEAIPYLRRALGVDPYSEEGTEALEKALIAAERWDELERLYRHRSKLIEEPRERVALLAKRARLYEQKLKDREALKPVLAELATANPPGNKYARHLRKMYREDEDWAELAALAEAELPMLEAEPSHAPVLCQELLDLATITREHLGEKDHAAELLHRVLSIDPANEEALARYSDHFRERRDWRGLADLLEFSYDNARDAGASVNQLVRQLEELCQVAELRLGDVDRAIATWGRIQQLEPQNSKARDALRRLMSRAKMWESLVGVLEQEAQAARTPQDRSEALRRIAQVYRERQVNPRRAIALYEEVLTMFPDDEGVLKALSELYEREGDDAGLANTLRRQLELDVRKMMGGQDQSRRTPTAREWPVAKRVERLTSLRRLASMYEQRLADVEGVVFACSGILEILPGDRDALDRMERVLEKAGDSPRLEQTLEYHAASATGPAERAKVLRRLARLAQQREDEVAAMERWEKVLKAAPNDADALDALAELYERHSRWGELAAVMERIIVTRKEPDQHTTAASMRAADLIRYARVVDHQLGDTGRAMRAWRKVLEVLPHDREALESLSRLYKDGGRWRDLAEVLAMQAPLYIEDEPETAAELEFQRAQILEDRLGAPAEAAKALETLLADMDPSNVAAHQSLRRLYEARGDFESAVRIAEREMYLTEEPQQKISRGLEIGLLCRDRLGDATRALQAFERVLGLKPDHEEALSAASELYARVEDWKNHVRTLERRVELVQSGRDRRALMMRAAQVTAEKIEDPKGAFAWYRKAHEYAPDATTIAELRRAAEAYDLWRELADIYEDARQRLVEDRETPSDIPAYVAASRDLAAIAERRLNNRKRAMSVLLDAVIAAPLDEGLLSEAERIAAEASQRPLWLLLLECLEAAATASDTERRVAMRCRRARVLEEHLEDNRGAFEELLKAFSYRPDRDETRRSLYELAERTGEWNDVVAVEAALFERAVETERRVFVLRRKAKVLEEHVADRVRAFRSHLLALLLDPDNSETSGHLWRLAREIGTYSAADRTPKTEPPAAHIEPEGKAAPRRRTTGGSPLEVRASTKRREPTEEISLLDVFETETNPNLEIKGPSRQDSTMPIDISELEIEFDEEIDGDEALELTDPSQSKLQSSELREAATMDLRTEDLITALGGREAKAAQPRAATPPETPTRGKGPPPPPPRPPQIKRQAKRGPAARIHSAGQVARRARTAKLPSMPSRAYASPWEELATAFEILPTKKPEDKLRWQFRAAEVWETGAEDIDRAFDVLARALEKAPDEPEPRARLHRLAEDHDAWDRLAGLYESAADEADTADSAVGLLLDVAEIRAKQGRARDTEALYRRILGMRPEDSTTREKLEALYRNEDRWVDLAASLEERTDPRLGTAAPEAERPALLRELAEIYSDRLSRPHDAIEAMVRLRDLAPEDLDLLNSLAELYGQVGRWSRVIEMFTRISEIAAGTNEARDAIRRIGEIYETELELPDRAIDAYTQLVTIWSDDSDAYAALDRLFETHARWDDLSETLRRRAALAREPVDRAALLRRRAKVLMDWMGAPEEAAAALRHARTIDPEDGSLADDLVQALTKAGREREAAAVLEGRIAALRDGGGGQGDIAALMIRLAGLRADQLDDPTGAHEILEEALAMVPNHPTALATLARLADQDADPRAYAAARLREADALEDIDAKVEALMSSGITLAERCNDIEGAREAFVRVLDLRPFHSQATWALAGLVEQGGDPETAASLLEQRLEHEALDDDEKPRILTQLAALARQAGVDAAAERRLTEALDVAPSHLPAVMALADLFDETNRWENLENFLNEVLPRLEDAPGAARAELNRRLALACEKLGRDDEAYQILLNADRMHRGHLLVKLALGENRYRARRWREAALHLSATADHDDAGNHPSEVAEGLYHAALAEIRSLRPEKASALYQRALELKPNYAPALRALAELAMEQGDQKKAADLLTRQATATEEPAERMKLFEALGDMAVMTLNDEERARVCYEAAVNAADPLEAKHLPLLEKLLERQDLANDNFGAARTAELMASFGADAQARAARYTAAAENYLAAGDEEKARAAAERAVDADPYALTGVTVLSEIMMKEEEYDGVAATLGRALSGDSQSDELTAARRSKLWLRLARARKQRGDVKGATTAFEKSVELASDSDGAMESRRALIDLWQEDPSKLGTILEYRRVLAADSVEAADVVEYAATLRESGEVDAAIATFELAEVLGQALTDADRGFLADHPPRTMASDVAYRGTLDSEDRNQLIRDGADEPMADLLRVLWEAAPLLWSEPLDALERCAVVGAARVGANSHHSASAIFPRVATALQIPATVLYSTDVPDAPDVQVVCVSAPIVVLGPRFQGLEGRDWSELEIRFLLGRAAELARPERVVAGGLPREDFLDLLESMKRVFGPKNLANEPESDADKYRDEMLRTTLPVKVRRKLEEKLAKVSARDIDPDRYLAACNRAADRAGLLVCGDVTTAVKHAGEMSQEGRRLTRHLIAMCLKPRYFSARARLGIGTHE